jgi:drug/metabolite transporter (DMT)-like permease
MDTGLFFAIATAVCFGTWPLITRAAGDSSSWAMPIVLAACMLTSFVARIGAKDAFPGRTAVAILVAAGIVNGLGALAYGRLITSTSQSMSALPSAALTAMIVVMAVGGFVFFKEAVTPSKLVGLALAAAGCYLLTK